MTRALSPSFERFRPAADGSDFGLRELMVVREIVHAFHTAERPGDVYQFALDRVTPLVGAAFACVYLTEKDSELMTLGAVHNWPQKYARFLSQLRVRMGAGPSGLAASERRVVEVSDVFSDANAADWRDVANELGFRSLVALPLQTGSTVLGAITFYFSDAGVPSAEARHLFQMVADQMAATAEKAKLIDDLRSANAALATSNAELERQYLALLDARRVKDEFLANISHELRTPLTTVIGYISLMQEGVAGPVTPDQQQTLAHVKASSEQLLSLIGDLLELTTLRRGGGEVTVSRFDIRDPMQEVLEMTPGRRPDVLLDVTMPPSTTIESDRRLVRKILGALLSNAYKFTHAGHVAFGATVAGDRVRYSVQDSGIGIPKDAESYVFEEFRQVDGTTTRQHGGSGLGLTLARRFARLLGGDILLTSSEGKGTTFIVDLPLGTTPVRNDSVH
ncbi:MAG TPA: GAF domain-containing sensor histidine kinase [Gemmatimonadaceae bacterium]|nr:GAF domain-containing sensor histidine kinase [Gemmatimonadaceae bacterium]